MALLISLPLWCLWAHTPRCPFIAPPTHHSRSDGHITPGVPITALHAGVSRAVGWDKQVLCTAHWCVYTELAADIIHLSESICDSSVCVVAHTVVTHAPQEEATFQQQVCRQLRRVIGCERLTRSQSQLCNEPHHCARMTSWHDSIFQGSIPTRMKRI